MKKTKSIVYILASILTLSACTGVKKLPQSSSTLLNSYTEGELTYKNQFRFKYLFFESQRLKALEDFTKAADLMEQCIAIDPFNADANFEMALLYMRTEQLTSALFYANQAQLLDPTNSWILLNQAQLNFALGNTEGELNAYKNLVKLDPSNIEYQYSLAQAYASNDLFKKAIRVYQFIENRLGVTEELSVVKERLYIALGDLKSAANELQKLISSFPNTVRYRGMLAELYQANNLPEKALKIYNEILKVDPKEPRANMALADHYRLKNDFEKVFKYLNNCFDNARFSKEVKLQILISYFQLINEDSIYSVSLASLLDKALLHHPTESGFYALYGDLFYQKNQIIESYKAYSKALDLGATEYFIWNRCLLMGLELQMYSEVISKGEKAIELNPVQPMLYLFTGLAYSIDNQQESAVLLLNRGLNYVVNNRPLKAEFYNYLGDAYHSLDLNDLSDTSYESALSLVPDNPIVLNNYSYYLSVREVKLEMAEEYSKLCNALKPNVATYQDTYGWILYKLARYSEAKDWLSKAIENSSTESAVIFEHYADALYQNGAKEEALRCWLKAVSLGGNSLLLLKKANEGVLYE